MIKGNILQNLPKELDREVFETIFKNKNIKIERIISYGQTSPINFWYKQEENEFVMLLSGEARLEYKDTKDLNLKKGDYTLLSAGLEHRVAFTSKNDVTIWLAIFF